MARGNKYTCRVCGKTYDYCPSCGLLPIPYLEDGFCCEDHTKIFTILSKHGCHVATAEETLSELDKFVMPTELAPSIKAHIDAIKAEVKPVEEVRIDRARIFEKK